MACLSYIVILLHNNIIVVEAERKTARNEKTCASTKISYPSTGTNFKQYNPATYFIDNGTLSKSILVQ